MAKTTKRKKGNGTGESVAERHQRQVKQELQRSIRVEKKIVQLLGQLRRAVRKSDTGLTDLGLELSRRAGIPDAAPRPQEAGNGPERP